MDILSILHNDVIHIIYRVRLLLHAFYVAIEHHTFTSESLLT